MIDLTHNLCIKCNINRASYSSDLISKPIYCKECKNDNDINVTLKRCLCKKTTSPVFNYLNKKVGICCKNCKLDGMINIKAIKCNCNNNKIATFGYPFDIYPSCCNNCKKENMIRIRDTLCMCKNSRACFGYENDKIPLYCNICKKNDMINLTSKICQGTIECKNNNIGCPYNIRANPKYDNYCVNCFINEYPKDIRAIYARKNTYELIVRDYLITEIKDYDFIHNKPLWLDNCECIHKRRIDFRCLINDTLLCIEVDENQHKNRDINDENIRYDDLFMIHSGKYIFIRFNPNMYSINSKIIKDNNLLYRLNILKTTIIDTINKIKIYKNNDLIQIIKLFYDENKELK